MVAEVQWFCHWCLQHQHAFSHTLATVPRSLCRLLGSPLSGWAWTWYGCCLSRPAAKNTSWSSWAVLPRSCPTPQGDITAHREGAGAHVQPGPHPSKLLDGPREHHSPHLMQKKPSRHQNQHSQAPQSCKTQKPLQNTPASH